MSNHLTQIRVSAVNIASIGNPILSALYSGEVSYSDSGVFHKEKGYQGKVWFDLREQSYYLKAGYTSERVKVGESLKIWLLAYTHGFHVFPITVNLTKDMAEIEELDPEDVLLKLQCLNNGVSDE